MRGLSILASVVGEDLDGVGLWADDRGNLPKGLIRLISGPNSCSRIIAIAISHLCPASFLVVANSLILPSSVSSDR